MSTGASGTIDEESAALLSRTFWKTLISKVASSPGFAVGQGTGFAQAALELELCPNMEHLHHQSGYSSYSDGTVILSRTRLIRCLSCLSNLFMTVCNFVTSFLIVLNILKPIQTVRSMLSTNVLSCFPVALTTSFLQGIVSSASLSFLPWIFELGASY